jgi:predicted HTH transcriptional regulator
MFQFAGLGEQAGSGIPKIWHNWHQQHWMMPKLTEKIELEQTTLVLKMVSLFPPAVLSTLQERFGDRLNKFSELQRLALAVVCHYGYVYHARLKDMSLEHSRDITMALAGLVREGILLKTLFTSLLAKPPKDSPGLQLTKTHLTQWRPPYL